MRDEIARIIADCPDTSISQIGNLWQVRVERHCDSGEDGAAVAAALMAQWRWERSDPYMNEPEPIEIPRFLAPDPLEGIPDALRGLAEPGETIAQMQARLWELWREMNGKLMLNLASPEEIALHTRLHNELHWIAPPLEGET